MLEIHIIMHHGSKCQLLSQLFLRQLFWGIVLEHWLLPADPIAIGLGCLGGLLQTVQGLLREAHAVLLRQLPHRRLGILHTWWPGVKIVKPVDSQDQNGQERT